MSKKNTSLPTWDLEAIYKTPELWEQDFQKLRGAAELFASFKGKLGDSAATLKEAVNACLSFNRLAEKIYIYAHLTLDQATGVDSSRVRMGKLQSLLAELAPLEAYFTPELLRIPAEKMDSFLQSPDLAFCKRFLEEILEERAHTLSEAEEKLLGSYSQVISLSGNLFDTLNDTDLEFGFIRDDKGNRQALTHGSYRALMEHPDRGTRKRTCKKLYKVYNQFRNTFAAALDGTVRRHAVRAKVRNYSSALNASLNADKVPESVYRSLIEAVHNNFPAFYDYMELRREVMKLDKLDMYDMTNPILEGVSKEYTFEEAADLIREAVKPMGEEYCQVLERAFRERWIDAPERPGKRSGAFSCGGYETYPYVLMTFTGTLKDLFTLAHELGHSMHNYFSCRNQPYIYSNYKIFVAEVASTTNEILLFEHLLSQATDPRFRAYLYAHILDEIRGTIYRQTMFAEFELFIHETVEQGTPLTAELLIQKYYELNKLYYGPSVKPLKEIGMEWARISHFHYNFYVYKYATGMSAALKLAANLRSGDAALREAYLGFLKAGCSKDVLDIMKDAGVDLSTPAPVNDALSYFGEAVKSLRNELKKCKAI